MVISRLLHGTTGLLLLTPLAVGQRESAQPAQEPLDLAPLWEARSRTGLWLRLPERDRGPVAEIVPLVAGSKVLVSTTLRLHAFEAASGGRAWSSAPPDGWEELGAARSRLWQGLDSERLLVSLAASSTVVVTALQIPLSRRSTSDWQGIQLEVALPERRLFAFELEGGRPLWNHAPPLDWDGASGPFSRRMHVCGSPLVVGNRVLVPCTSDESSIDYHVACYALDTGALLWTTFVTRGQVERNMFGNQAREFAATPLVIAPDGTRVLTLTGLGRIAVLALHDGAILWSTEYDSTPLPKTRSYNPPRGPWTWRTAPPVVVDGILWATPRDGAKLLALDLGSGELLASVPAAELKALAPAETKLELDHLIGVEGGLVWLGGSGAAAFAREGDLRSPAWRLRWVHPGQRTSVRTWLEGGELIVPGLEGVRVLDALTGTARAAHPSPRLLGLAATETRLYLLGPEGLLALAR